jgi:hypothetical protein
MLVLGRMEESRAAWRKAMFAATTTGGVDDRENSEAIRAFGFAYGGCVMSPPPAVDNECLEWAINRMTDERSESASPERVQAERATVLKLFDHLTVGAEPAT